MYQALYRKYRPLTFADVSGQETITATLQNAIKSGRISHAYLFCGIRGTGKTTCAKILAKAVNCLNPKDGNPCGECENCKAVSSGATDIMEIDAASNNGVDNIRELREQVGFMPAVLKYKVYIIDEVHMLSPSAFNALLKTLEEPPEHIIFILATTEINKLPATIVSRCQRYDFKRIPTDVITDRLMTVAGKENINLTKDAARLIASLSDGGLRDAISFLDLCASLSDTVDVKCVQDACGSSDFEDICKIIDYLAAKDSDGIFEITERLHRDGNDMKILLGDILVFLRNMMIIKTAKNPAPLTGLTPERFEKTKTAADGFSLDYIMYCMQAVSGAAVGQNPKIDAQLTLIKMIYPESDDGMGALISRIEKLEKGAAIKPQTAAPKVVKEQPAAPKKAQEKPKAEPPKPAEKPQEKPAVKADIKEGQLQEWEQVLNLIKTANRPLFGVLFNSKAYFKDGRVLIDSPLSSFREMINSNPATKEALKGAIAEVYGKPYPIGPYKKDEGDTAPQNDGLIPLDEDAPPPFDDGDDPLIAFGDQLTD